MAKLDIVASINQTGAGIRLPNFCNLGVMLRSLVIVNVLIAAAAVVRTGSYADFAFEFVTLAAPAVSTVRVKAKALGVTFNDLLLAIILKALSRDLPEPSRAGRR